LSQDGNNELYAQVAAQSIQKRRVFSFTGGVAKVVVQKITPAIIPLDILRTLLHARTDLGIDQPRCDNPALSAVVKWNAPPPSQNGCGSPPFTVNYQPFVDAQCCAQHDFCFGAFSH
jgi:hypothetical protein